MQIIIYPGTGGLERVRLDEVARPAPTEHQVLVRVLAASINALDWRPFTMAALMRRNGLWRPQSKPLGVDLAGRVEAVGAAVTGFRPGDAVFGVAPGAFGDYVLARDERLALKPATVSFAAAAAVPIAGFTALQAVRDRANVQPGQRVLVYGASGGVGNYTVQIAKAFGAGVTAVVSPRNVALARQLGADEVLDYTRDDFTAGGARYDAILAVNGYQPIGRYRRALRPGGAYVVLGGALRQIFEAMLLGPWLGRLGGQRLSNMLARSNQPDLEALRDLLAAGKLTPVIDRTYPLAETAAALRYVIETHAQGKVLIAPAGEAEANAA